MLIVFTFCWAARHIIIDDGLIYARFVQNALRGRGLVFNQGQAVNALTSPLLSYALLGFSWLLHGRVLLAEHLIFALTFTAACLLAERLAKFAGLVLAVTGYFYLTTGLETSTFLLLLVLTFTAYIHDHIDWLPTLCVLSILTRFEAGLLIPILGWLLWKDRKKPAWTAFLPALALIAIDLLLNYHWYGNYLPNSTSAKLGQARSGYWGEWPTAFFVMLPVMLKKGGMLRPVAWVLPVLLGLIGVALWKKPQPKLHRLSLPFLLGLLAFYVLFNLPSYHWYYAPFIFCGIVYAVLGLPESVSRREGGLLVMACIALIGVVNFRYVAQVKESWDYINVANWINKHSAGQATVEAAEIGYLGFYTQRDVIDIVGLTEPKNAVHIAHRDVTTWLEEDQPDNVVVHRPIWIFEKVAAESPAYREVPYHSGAIHILQRTSAKQQALQSSLSRP